MEIKVESSEPKYELTMTLNRGEAEALRTMVYQFGGAPTGPRSVADSIGEALQAQGVGACHLTNDKYLPDTYEELHIKVIQYNNG
tara:strand:- start:274 stop:528 length:255 start_codon:yes stop_codon:yes gene_type:complete